jgi:hypothetical protein
LDLGILKADCVQITFGGEFVSREVIEYRIWKKLIVIGDRWSGPCPLYLLDIGTRSSLLELQLREALEKVSMDLTQPDNISLDYP